MIYIHYSVGLVSSLTVLPEGHGERQGAEERQLAVMLLLQSVQPLW